MVVEVMKNMKHQNKETPKSKWSQIFKKKWFFPAVYLIIATVLLTLVIRYQMMDPQDSQLANDHELEDQYVAGNDDPSYAYNDEEAEPVIDQQEVLRLPVADQNKVEIVTRFYEYDADDEEQKQALIFHNNRYYQSTGIDIVAEDGESFDVLAALSGTVSEVKEDPLLGNVVILVHENDVSTYYASLEDVQVQAGEQIKQGEVIGTAGKSIFGKDHGNHVHFEVRKNEQPMNPETFLNQPMSKIDTAVRGDHNEDEADKEESSNTNDEFDNSEGNDSRENEEE